MMRKFFRSIWNYCGDFAAWINLELDFKECTACGAAAVWRISQTVYVCNYHHQWGMNKAVLLGEEVINKIIKTIIVTPTEGGLR